MIPPRLLPHEVVKVSPGSGVDGYGEAAADWSDGAVTRVPIRAFVQPAGEREVGTDGRDAQISDWLMFTNDLTIDGGDRIEWEARTLEVVGPAGIQSTPRGPSHAEVLLREVQG